MGTESGTDSLGGSTILPVRNGDCATARQAKPPLLSLMLGTGRAVGRLPFLPPSPGENLPSSCSFPSLASNCISELRASEHPCYKGGWKASSWHFPLPLQKSGDIPKGGQGIRCQVDKNKDRWVMSLIHQKTLHERGKPWNSCCGSAG